MAEVQPITGQHSPKRLGAAIKPDGVETPLQADADGKLLVDITATIADDVSIQATNDAAVDTNIWDDGAGAPAALAALVAYGNVIATGGKSNWTLKCNLSDPGAGITRVDLIVRVASSAAGVFFPIQVKSIAATGIVTLTDAWFQRAIAAADQYAFDVDIKGNAVFQVGALAGAGDPTGSLFLITAQPAGV